MFEEPSTYVDDVPRAMEVQVMILAQELEHTFYERDRTVDRIFVGAILDEIKRDVTTPTGYTLGWASGAPRHR